jgi:hypothetical protein
VKTVHFVKETKMALTSTFQFRDTTTRAERNLPGERAREPRRSPESGIVKLEKRRTPWWSNTLGWTVYLVWRGGW